MWLLDLRAHVCPKFLRKYLQFWNLKPTGQFVAMITLHWSTFVAYDYQFCDYQFCDYLTLGHHRYANFKALCLHPLWPTFSLVFYPWSFTHNYSLYQYCLTLNLHIVLDFSKYNIYGFPNLMIYKLWIMDPCFEVT